MHDADDAGPSPDRTLRLRYFFDAGSGTCLWSGNSAAEACFGYAVDMDDLPLGANTRDALRHLEILITNVMHRPIAT
jgi:hypothetical protein